MFANEIRASSTHARTPRNVRSTRSRPGAVDEQGQLGLDSALATLCRDPSRRRVQRQARPDCSTTALGADREHIHPTEGKTS